jgi:hypothetical protein
LKTALFLCTLFVLAFATPNFAQAPSLAPADAYYVSAKTEFGTETFTIIRDGRREEQFYFVPARPHVAIEKRNGKDYPVFQLLSYQRKKDNELIQGGILQFSVQTAISKATENELLNTIKGKFPLSDSKKQHRLSPIPMKEAVISMYDLDGKLLQSAPVKEGIAPIFGNQQFPFMLNLTDLGADAMKAMTTGHGGLPVLITYTFQGMTPPGGFKIEVNWDNCYKHLSSDTKLRANVAYASLGANLGADMTKIREEMESNGMMKITALSNEALSDTALDAAMNPVIDLITKELFENIKAPPQIDPASAKEIAAPEIKDPPAGSVTPAASVAEASGVAPAKGTDSAIGKPAADNAAAGSGDAAAATGAAAGAAVGDAIKGATSAATGAAGEAAKGALDAAATSVPYVGTIMKVLDVAADIAKNSKVAIGASYALKDAQYVKKGSFVYTYDRQAIVDRKTSFGGPIGIGSFDKKIQNECITVLPDGNWEAAYYTLPSVGDSDSLGYKQINLSVTPVFGDKQIAGQKIESAIYKANTETWTDKNGKETRYFLFPLKAVYDSADYKSNPAGFRFRVKAEVVPLTGQSFVVDSYVPMFDGELAMSPPTDLMQAVKISTDGVTYGAGDNEIFFVKGALKADNLTLAFKLDANKGSQGFLIPKGAKSVKITGMQFFNKKGKKFDWAGNNRQLSDIDANYDITLFDSDWDKSADTDSIMGEPEPQKK